MPDRKRVIALGFFDGVHRGHAALMEMTKRRAAELDAIPAVLTFDTHPDTLVKKVDVPLINSPEVLAAVLRQPVRPATLLWATTSPSAGGARAGRTGWRSTAASTAWAATSSQP